MDAIIHVLHHTNLFFETMKPWELKKRPECQKELDIILHITLETLRICSILLQPIIPKMSETILDKLQIPKENRFWHFCVPSWRQNGVISETTNIQSGKLVLFQRIYVDKVKKKASGWDYLIKKVMVVGLIPTSHAVQLCIKTKRGVKYTMSQCPRFEQKVENSVS